MPAYVPSSYREYASNGSTAVAPVPFPYLNRSHVGVYLDMRVDAGTYTRQLLEGIDYTWANDTTIGLTPALPNGQAYTVRRITPSNQLLVAFSDASNLTARDLNVGALQILYVTQELEDLNAKLAERTIVLIEGTGGSTGTAALGLQSASFTTLPIANLAAVDFTLPLGEMSQLKRLALSHPGWVRFYRSAAQRNLDTRLSAGGTLQGMIDLGDGKPYAECVTTGLTQGIEQNPIPTLRGDSAGLVYIRLVNQSGLTQSLTLSTLTIKLED
jgi:hypothetical protein